jgi:hypothetical protein
LMILAAGLNGIGVTLVLSGGADATVATRARRPAVAARPTRRRAAKATAPQIDAARSGKSTGTGPSAPGRRAVAERAPRTRRRIRLIDSQLPILCESGKQRTAREHKPDDRHDEDVSCFHVPTSLTTPF